MAAALFELSRNQDIQDKVRADIEQALKTHKGEFTYETLSDMNYLESCIYGMEIIFENSI